MKVCGVVVDRPAGEKLGTDPVDRSAVNVGTVLGSPNRRLVRHSVGVTWQRPGNHGGRCAGLLVVAMSIVLSSCGRFIEEPTPLLRAIGDQDLARVERLLNQGADPNQRGLVFPLQAAAAKENVGILELLLARGAVLASAIR
jgi:hypothetical protein